MKTEIQQSMDTQPKGLSPELNQKAIDLFKGTQTAQTALNLTNSEINLRELKHATDLQVGADFMSPFVDTTAIAIKKHGVKKAHRQAKRHYKKHEGDYQDQAYLDATTDGHDINGWPYAKSLSRDTGKNRLGNTALAAIDGAFAANFAANLDPKSLLSMRELVASYLIYRYGKGVAVRGTAAIRGKGDTEMQLAPHIPVSALHLSKREIKKIRKQEQEDAQRDAGIY